MKSLIIITLLTIVIYQTSAKDHQIDKIMSECLESRFENNVMEGDCYSEAQKAWDKELNKVYKQLKKHLSKELFKELKTAQIKWIQFKEKELEFIGSFYHREDQEMYNVSQAYASIAYKEYELTKSRTIELQIILILLLY
jgi:uncharacterized protein YecT (DUF1311 family)